MKPTSLVAAVVLLINTTAWAVDAELVLRPHASRIIYGDPLYCELELKNRSQAVFETTIIYIDHDHLRFEIRDHNTGLFIWHHNALGQPSPTTVQGNESVTFYQYLFCPGLLHQENAFWASGQKRRLSICAVYRVNREGMELRSGWHDLDVSARDKDEMAVLNEWSARAIDGYDRGPSPTHFGIELKSPLGREWTDPFMGHVQSQELNDLLKLTSLLQDVHAASRDDIDDKITAVINWLMSKPAIKRKLLAREASVIAEAENMREAAERIRAWYDKGN